ncbi:MAG TPA: protein kinase [Actinomycetota bacterium]|nr:protein kinase [Actinomycetota bacterium]
MSAPLTEPSLLGSLLAGRYEIRAPLGRGGMGEVFEAVDRRLGRTVAIKVLRQELAANDRFLARFRREAATAAGLAHVGIVSVHDIGDDAGRTYIVMEFVAGRTLVDLDRDADAHDPRWIARIGAAAARALAHAHERGIVHRDVSPANIMVTTDGAVKILDFGIARDGGDAHSSAASRGTIAYVAPEVLRGGTADARADLYSLGAVLAELARGLDDHRLRAALDRATATDPVARFASATAFSGALDAIAAGTDPVLTPRTGERHRPARDRTEPIVRIATRPLASASSSRPVAEPARSSAPLQPTVEPARGIVGSRPRRRRRGARLGRTIVVVALIGVAIGSALVLGQAFVTMSTPQPAGTVTGPDPVPAPTGLVGAASCDGLFSTGVDLAWTGSGPVKGYEILRKGGTGERTLVARLRGVHTEAFRDADLGVDASYRYRVRAFDGPRVSEWSNAVDIATPFLCLT